jgi:hypothetical protein
MIQKRLGGSLGFEIRWENKNPSERELRGVDQPK